MARKKGEPIDRFMAKVEKTSTCWIWRGGTMGGDNSKNRYGQFSFNLKVVYTHRFIWEYHNGPIPAGMCVCHTCDNSLCVRLDHLFLGTRKDNTQDMVKKGRNRGWRNPEEVRRKLVIAWRTRISKKTAHQ